jgi:tetratricopeptide (TPR) repeat protein
MRLLAVVVSAVCALILLPVATNIATGVALPSVVSRNRWLSWVGVVVFGLAAVLAVVWEQRIRARTGGPLVSDAPPVLPQPKPQSWGDLGDSVAVLVERLPEKVVGREPLLDTLERHLSQCGLVVLVGGGGTGKSTVARELVRQVRRRAKGKRGPPFWEVSGATPVSLTAGLVTVARSIGADEADLEAIATGRPIGPDRLWQLLEDGPKGWLLIVDNADETAILAKPAVAGAAHSLADGTGWVRASTRGLVLVTSRQRDPHFWPGEARLYPVGLLSDEDAAKVLRNEAPEAGDTEQAVALAHRLGGLPLALRLAGRYLAAKFVDGASFDAYRRELDANPAAIQDIDPDPDSEEGQRATVMRTWEISLDALARRGLPHARPLLRLLSCYAPALPIPLGLLQADLVDPYLRAALGRPQPAPVRMDQALRGLDRLGLIERDIVRSRAPAAGQEPRNTEEAVTVHPVIADTNRVHLLKPKAGDPPENLVRRTAVATIATRLAGLGSERPDVWPVFRSLTPHLQALLVNSAPRMDKEDLRTLVGVTGRVSAAHGQMRLPELGVELATSVLAQAERRGVPPGPVTWMAWQQVAFLLSELDSQAEAEAIYRQVLAGQLRRWPADDPVNLAVRQSLALSVAAQGRRAEAVAALRELLDEEQRLLGKDHRFTLATRRNLAVLTYGPDTWEETVASLRDVLADATRLLGNDDPFTLTTRYNLAMATWHVQGLRPEAETALRSVLDDARQAQGEEAYIPVTGAQYEKGAFFFAHLIGTPGQRAELARDLFNRGIDMGNQELREEAIAAYDELLRRFGDDDSPGIRDLVAKGLSNKAVNLHVLDRTADAADAYDELERRFGEDGSPEFRALTAQALRNAAVARFGLKQYEEALSAATRAVERYRQLAEEDPDSFSAELTRAQDLLEKMTTQAAAALLAGAVKLGQDGKPPEAELEAYERFLALFRDSSLPAVRELIAMALFNKALVLSKLASQDAGAPG